MSQFADGAVQLDRFARQTGERIARRPLGRGSVPSAIATEHGALLLAIAGGEPKGGGRLVVIASLRDTVEHVIPVCETALRAVHLWEAGRRIYAVCADDTVIELDTDLWIPLRQESIAGVCDPRGVSMSANGTIVMVLCGGGRLLYLDRVLLSPLDSASIGGGASEITRTPDGGRALIAFTQANEIALVDLRRRTVVARVPVPHPRGMVMDGDGRSAYVLAGAPGELQEIATIDLNHLAISARTPAPSEAQALAVWPTQWSPTMRWEERMVEDGGGW